MKPARRMHSPAAATLALLALVAPHDAAATPRVIRETAFSLSTNGVLDDLHWVMAETADIAGRCADDLFVIAQAITLRGQCENDLWAMGDQVSIAGRVGDHARLAGLNISIAGEVANGLQAVGNSINLLTGSVVRGSAAILADSATVSGTIAGGLSVMAGQCTLSGTVQGPVRVVANDIVVMPGTRIQGDLRYTAPEDLVLDPRVELSGELIRQPFAAPSEQPRVPWQMVAVGQFIFLIGAALSGLLFMALFPRFTGNAVLALRQAPARCGLAGALGLAFLPMAALAAAVTVVGLPVALLLAALFGCLLYLGKVVVAIALGALLLRRSGPQPFGQALRALLLGLPVLYLAAMVPTAGPLLRLLVSLLGLGALLSALWRRPDPAAPPVPS